MSCNKYNFQDVGDCSPAIIEVKHLLYCLTTQHIGPGLPTIPRPQHHTVGVDNNGGLPTGDDSEFGADDEQDGGFGLLSSPDSSDTSSAGNNDASFHTAGSLSGGEEGGLYPVVMFKYVDDSTSVEAVDASTAIKHYSMNRATESIYPEQTESLLDRINERSKEIGMIVNCKKTQMLCVSLDNGCDTNAEIVIGDETITSTDTMKLLGFVFNSKGNMDDQVALIRRKFRGRFWSLVHLRKSGFKREKLFKMYSIFVRPLIETNSVIYNSMITRTQSREIEGMQRKSVKLAFGLDSSYQPTCADKNIETLEARRAKAFDRFVSKSIHNPRFSEKWLSRREEIRPELRNRRPFIEEKARTSRLYRSPLFALQRRANDLMTSN